MEIFEKFLTQYGPLGLGWVFFYLQWRENNKWRGQEIATKVKLVGALSGLTKTLSAVHDIVSRLPRQ
jgi:hypothetical protein